MIQYVQITLDMDVDASLDKKDIKKKLDDMFNFATLHSNSHERMLIPRIEVQRIREEAEIYENEHKAVTFPNGFTSWIETSVEITSILNSAQDIDQIELEGQGELYELVEKYTNEFEQLHKNINWDCFDDQYFEAVDQFMENKIKEINNEKGKN